MLPSEFLEILISVKAPKLGVGLDLVAWFPIVDGTFSLKSAYLSLTENVPSVGTNLFKNV